MIECFLTNLYSIDVMAPFCLEMKKKGIDCHLALDELFWQLSYGEHFDIDKAIKKAKEWEVKLNLRLNYNSKIAVTQWKVDWELFGLYKNLKAHISYGIGLNKQTHFACNDYRFDLYFVHGAYEKELLLKQGINKERILMIGYPKLDYQKINFRIKKKKKVITYLPTWDKFNCIDIAIKKLVPLKKEYEIFVKPHPLQKKEDLEKLKTFNLLDKEVTIKSIVNFSDIIVGDLKSGVMLEIPFFKKNILLIGLTQKKYLNNYTNLINIIDLIITEDKPINCDIKPKNKNTEYFITKEQITKEKLNVKKISPTINKDTLEIYKERLEKYYNEFYRKNT